MLHATPFQRFVAVLSAALLTAGFALAAITAPASAAPPDKGSLRVVSVTDTNQPELGVLVQNRPFDVVVDVRDASGQLMSVNQATTLVLEELSGPGDLGGTTTAVIPRNGSGTTFSGATYSQYANGIVLRVRAVSGVQLASATITIHVALTAVGRTASPHLSFELSDPNCAVPTAEVPICGYLRLPNGANGQVTLALGSCENVPGSPSTECRTVGDTTGLLVTALAELKDTDGTTPLYTDVMPATLIVGCDKTLCGQAGVPRLPLIVDLTNTGTLTEAPPCPAKGVLGAGQQACTDYVQSVRSDGDLYTYLLFRYDIRCSHP